MCALLLDSDSQNSRGNYANISGGGQLQIIARAKVCWQQNRTHPHTAAENTLTALKLNCFQETPVIASWESTAWKLKSPTFGALVSCATMGSTFMSCIAGRGGAAMLSQALKASVHGNLLTKM